LPEPVGEGDLGSSSPNKVPQIQAEVESLHSTKATSLLLGFEVKVPLGLDYRIGLATAMVINITFAKKN